MSRSLRTAIPAAVTAAALVTGLLAVPSATAAENNHATAVTAAHRAEFTRMVDQLTMSVLHTRSAITTSLPDAEKMRADWGYESTFDAVDQFKRAAVAATAIDNILETVGDTPTPNNENQLRQARSLAAQADAHISRAFESMKKAEKTHASAHTTVFTCANAIDEGDESGSSLGSSTAGLFNSTGNRVIYDDSGYPSCTTNFQFFMAKTLKFISLVTSALSFIGTLVKVFGPPAPADQPADKTAPAAQ